MVKCSKIKAKDLGLLVFSICPPDETISPDVVTAPMGKIPKRIVSPEPVLPPLIDISSSIFTCNGIEDWTQEYLYNLVLVDNVVKRLAYVECDYYGNQ